MSESLLRLLTHELHLGALAFMGLVYAVRIIWIFRFPAPSESTPPRGSHGAGISYALMNIALPWELDSYRRKPLRYVEFVVFHVGVAVAIAGAVLRPETDSTLFATSSFWNDNAWLGSAAQVICAAAALAGVMRLVRRIARPEMRAISSPDDYFSVALLTAWLGAGVFGLPAGAAALPTGIFYAITTFFLIYVPFSKISHYLYYPFNKWYLGKHLGHRAVYPKGRPVVVHLAPAGIPAARTVVETSRAHS